MSSLQPLRELISERLAAAAEEICRLCEGTIVQYEQELCRQRRLLDVIWKPQLQLHHIVLPQHWVTEEEGLCNQQSNFSGEQEEQEPPLIEEEQEEPELPHIKEEQDKQEEQEYSQIKKEPVDFCISQDEDQLDLKQETDTLMEIPTYDENESSEADLNNHQSFNVTDSQDEEENQHEESTSTTDEETDSQNRDQRKRRDKRHVQSVDSSHMSAVLPQHWVTEEEGLCNQQSNFSGEQEEQEPPLIEEEQEEPELPHIKEEQDKQEEQEYSQIKKEPVDFCISQDEDQLDLKQETDTLMEIPTYDENESSEADLNNHQSFNVTDSQDEEENQHEESTSTTDEETDSQNRDQRKRRDKRHVQSVDSSHMSAVLPQHWVTEEEGLCNQQSNFSGEQEEQEPPLIEEEQEEPELPHIKEEQDKQEEQEYSQIKKEPVDFCISQDEDQLDLKQETDTLMEIPTYDENESSEADLNNHQSFNVTDSQDEEENQHEESTSTTDEETDSQNRDQRKRRDKRHVQSVDSSHMSAGQCGSDFRKSFKKASLGKKRKQSPKEERLSSMEFGKNSRIITKPSDYMETASDERCYICKECDKSFCNKFLFKIHARIHPEDKVPFV
ncbi:uncharacterized protein LOC144986818 isoform X2 [Oryzias latipes]